MILIAAADLNWGIGLKGKLLTSIPEDMKFFRETTTGNVVVMGRRTLESFPHGMPLKNRTNIVMTRRKDYDGKGAVTVHDAAELKNELEKYKDRKVYLIGGGSMYREFIADCDSALITRLYYEYEADTFMPNLEEQGFKVVYESDEMTYFSLVYRFVRYER